MNTNNPKRFGWDNEADGTQLTPDEMLRIMTLKAKAARDGEGFHAYSQYLMADGKVFERKHSNSKIWLAVALAMIAGSAIAVLEISGWLPQMLPTALGGGPL
jgi:hypothetical protein